MADRPRTHSLASLADEDLLAQVGRADDEAFAVLYDRHARVALVREEAGRIEPDAAEAAIGVVEAESVRRALADLPAEQLDVVRLAYFGGFTHQEIAEALEVSLGTVKSRMRLALERIRRSMDPGGTGLSPA